MNLAIDRLKGWIARRPASTEGHTETARETGVALGLMAQAADAAGPTPEQQIFLSQAEHGMRERLSMLLGIPHRSLAQEREKLAIEQWLARGSPQEPVQTPRRFLGPLMAANPLAGVLMSPALWVAAAFAVPAVWGGVKIMWLKHERDAQCARQELVEHSRTTRQPCIALGTALRANADLAERAEHYRQGLVDAANVARLAAQNLETERAAHARAAARERRRNAEIANVLAHSADPPAWRLRDDEPATDQPTAPTP